MIQFRKKLKETKNTSHAEKSLVNVSPSLKNAKVVEDIYHDYLKIQI